MNDLQALHSKAYSAPSISIFRGLTLGYAALVIGGATWLGFFDPAGVPIGPSDWGDVLAGVFSPLAFLWLVFTALAQRAELSMQRLELQQNNATQDLQQQQMRRQADVLTAQAHAQFEPVLVCKRVRGHRSDTFVHAEFSNEGAAALSVTTTSPMELEFLSLRQGLQEVGLGNDDAVLAHFPNGSALTVRIRTPSNQELPINVVLQMSRLDLQTFIYNYRLHMSSGRLELIGRTSAISGSAILSFSASAS